MGSRMTACVTPCANRAQGRALRSRVSSRAMCFDLDSCRPIAPIAGAAISHQDLSLAPPTAVVRGVRAVPDGRPGGDRDPSGHPRAVPVLRGAGPALRERGHRAVAFDYFGRTAGVGEARRRLRLLAAREQTYREGAGGRRARWSQHLRAQGARACHGRLLLRRAPCLARDGRGARPRGRRRLLRQARGAQRQPGPTQRARELDAPMLALMGGADEGSRSTMWRSSARRCRRRARSTRSSSTTARRTRSSTASRRSSPRRPRTRGGGRSHFIGG